MTNIAYFDLRLSSIKRFPLWIHNAISANTQNNRLIFFYEEDDIDKTLIDLGDLDYKLIKIEDISYKFLEEHLNRNKVSKIFVFAQRIPDSFIVAVSKKLNIKTFMFQHGLYVPFMKREPSLIIQNIHKTYRYLVYSLRTAELIRLSKLKLIQNYISIFIFGTSRKKIKLPTTQLNVDKVFVYGDYWKKYHNEQFNYEYDHQIVVGTPDFQDIPNLLQNKKIENSICYIAQTLVEDGRLNRKIMINFMESFSKIVKDLNIKLYIKLHPRSDMSLYNMLPKETVYIKEGIPNTESYIGHYSSLIAKTVFLAINCY